MGNEMARPALEQETPYLKARRNKLWNLQPSVSLMVRIRRLVPVPDIEIASLRSQ
jgi:hypothetical protein